MSPEIVTRYWALLMAGVLGAGLLLFVLWRVWLQSPHGQLAGARRHLRIRTREANRTQRELQRSSRALAKLQGRATSVRPRQLQVASESVEDARSLAKIAHDQLLIAENLMRKVIVEEFPPRRHEALRRRYLRSDEERGKPFQG
jgi:hypothetical protein